MKNKNEKYWAVSGGAVSNLFFVWLETGDDDDYKVRLVDITGTKPVQIKFFSKVKGLYPTSHGFSVLYKAEKNGNSLSVIDDYGNIKRLRSGNIIDVSAFSADGSVIAYISSEGKEKPVYKLRIPMKPNSDSCRSRTLFSIAKLDRHYLTTGVRHQSTSTVFFSGNLLSD